MPSESAPEESAKINPLTVIAAAPGPGNESTLRTKGRGEGAHNWEEEEKEEEVLDGKRKYWLVIGIPTGDPAVLSS